MATCGRRLTCLFSFLPIRRRVAVSSKRFPNRPSSSKVINCGVSSSNVFSIKRLCLFSLLAPVPGRVWSNSLSFSANFSSTEDRKRKLNVRKTRKSKIISRGLEKHRARLIFCAIDFRQMNSHCFSKSHPHSLSFIRLSARKKK